MFEVRSLTKIEPVSSIDPVITRLSTSIKETSPTSVVLPVTFKEPVNVCVSSNESPNFVDPLSSIIDDDTYSV